MKRFLLLSLAALLLCPLAAQAGKPVRITVLSYNIQGAKRFPTEKYAEFIQKYQPDLVAFQEVDYMTKRFKEKPDFLSDVARMTGMHPVYAAAMAFSDVASAASTAPASISGSVSACFFRPILNARPAQIIARPAITTALTIGGTGRKAATIA